MSIIIRLTNHKLLKIKGTVTACYGNHFTFHLNKRVKYWAIT